MFLNFVSREARLIKGQSLIDFNKFNLFTYSRDAIYKIAEEIKLSEEDEVLLPDYICNTVIDTLYEFTKKIILYKVDKKLRIDENEIRLSINKNIKMIIFVDYFGVETDISIELIKTLREYNIKILKDSAHSFLTLVKNDFKSKYEYDYLISSIYKNLDLKVGAIGIGDFKRKYNFIDSSIVKKRKKVLFFKKILCFLGISIINKGIENIIIQNDKYIKQAGKNMSEEYISLLTNIDFTSIISIRDDLSIEFYNYFEKYSLFSLEQIKLSSLQVFPLMCTSKENRDKILKVCREKCIDTYTWPTFHKIAVNEKLWSKIVLIPLDRKVLNILKREISNV